MPSQSAHPALIEASGLELPKISNYHLQGPKAFGYMYEGIAAKPLNSHP